MHAIYKISQFTFSCNKINFTYNISVKHKWIQIFLLGTFNTIPKRNMGSIKCCDGPRLYLWAPGFPAFKYTYHSVLHIHPLERLPYLTILQVDDFCTVSGLINVQPLLLRVVWSIKHKQNVKYMLFYAWCVRLW